MLFPTDPIEAVLLEQLADDPVHVDELCRATGLPIATVTSTLALMELKGMVRSAGGMTYVRADSGPGGSRRVTGTVDSASVMMERSCDDVVRRDHRGGLGHPVCGR